jgi:hypothetical protein
MMTKSELGAYLKAGVDRVNELERRKIELGERVALKELYEAKLATVEEVCQGLWKPVAEAERDFERKQDLV